MPNEATQKEIDDGPTQKAPGYDDTIERDTGHDTSIEDPDPGGSPVSDPDTEGAMGQPDEEGADDQQSNYSIGG